MIYIHVPFCRSFCTYCGFYSEVSGPCSPLYGRFAAAVRNELKARMDELDFERNTLYIGGGTPSVLPLPVLSEMVSPFARLSPGKWEEFTVEVNPDDITAGGPSYVEGLKNLGVTRVSMGVQSFDDRVLRWMNRRHNSSQAVQAYRMLRDGGFDNISIDLISGFVAADYGHGETMPEAGYRTLLADTDESWHRTIDKALEISGDGTLPAHISAYQLSVEDGSALAGMLEDGRFKEAPDEFCRGQYEYLCNALAAAGYHHYEISNFALPGREARHNSGYWEHVPYCGFGPGAHSLLCSGGRKIRRWNEDDLKAYLQFWEAPCGAVNAPSGTEELTEGQLTTERIMLSLRTGKGADESFLRGSSGDETVDRMLSEGLLERNAVSPDRLRIPESRFFIADSIISRLV